jgi:23S rRNA pseudouridine955/2504/2580 synthase
MKTPVDKSPAQVQVLEISVEHEGQRVDNFLLSYLKGVPKSRIYRMLRSGEVRINKGRCAANRRLLGGDLVRIPPVRTAQQKTSGFIPPALQRALQQQILYEDEVLLIVNKPPGFAVHGGSGVDSGVIEGLRQLRAEARFLELVHRLDRDTSGCLLIAKKGSALRKLHELFRGDGVDKTYLALLSGQWARKKQTVTAPLLKNVNKGGERMVIVSPAGKEAETRFRRIRLLERATLVEASPKTGRTHQIRVHAAHLGHPIVGDERYGLAEVNREFKAHGVQRLFLHAEKLSFPHPESGQLVSVTAALPEQLTAWLEHEK